MTASASTRHRRWRAAFACAGAAFAALSASAASAHDFFLRPAAYTIAPGSVLSVDATVSAAFPELLNPVSMDRVRELRVSSGGKRASLEAAGVGARSLKLRFHGRESGWAVLSIRTVTREVEYPEDRIGGIMEEYEVGPEAVRAVAALQAPRVLKVASSRFAKSLVCVGRCESIGEAARPVGHDLEFVAALGAPNAFRLLAGGKPLADYPVAVVGPDGERRRLRTTGGGGIELPSGTKGPVMLFASVMTPPTAAGARFALKLASLTVEAR